ncbi:uncharacterized protein isoform X2 [Rhodnius prolixus]|uniref:Uncharacterized protein n=2 Tax=Rhodnius TaxID=13248 RepID=T1HV93_RHOPR
MPEPNLTHHHELVLNAIDVISYRKNRPNIARIYRHLVRFSSISSAICEKLIDELVEQGRVIKVTYKGNISYRNAAKWKHMNRHKNKNDPNRKSASEKRASSILSGTIAELVVREPTYFRTGVPCKVLEDHLLIKDGRFTKESIHKLLQKELKQETLVQLDNGNYFLALNNSTSNSTTSEDSESRNFQETEDKKNESNDNEFESIEEIQDDEDDYDIDDGDFDEEFEDEELDEEEEEDEDELEEKAEDSVKEKSDSRPVEISGESEDEVGANDPFQNEDKDYLPPRNLSVSTRRSSSGRLSVRNKKTRYDPSEYVIPSLKRTYKVRQEKNTISKQQEKKRSNLLTSKEFKRALLNPIPGYSGGSTINPTKSVTTTLQKNRLPEVPLKAVQFGSSDAFSGVVCAICNDSKVPVTKSVGIRCKICQRRAHTGCVKNEQVMTKLQVETSSWTCASCRYIIAQPCCVCHQASSKIGPLVICGTCKLSYHRSCHQPPIPKEEALTGSWRCSNCPTANLNQDGGENINNKSSANFFNLPKIGTITAQRINEDSKEPDGKFEEVLIDEAKEKIIISSSASFPHIKKKQVSLLQINDSAATRPQQQYTTGEQQFDSQSQTTSPTSSPPSSQLTAEDVLVKEEISDELSRTLTPKKLKEEEFSQDIPDTSSWSPIDVFNYFKDKFDETVANVFLKQEIDGNSLKLLRRSDVLRGLGFKLGIGLNVLYHVKMLQLKTNDLKVIWAAE